MLLKLLSVVLLVAPLCSPNPKIYLIETKDGGGLGDTYIGGKDYNIEDTYIRGKDYNIEDTYFGGKDYAGEGRIFNLNFVTSNYSKGLYRILSLLKAICIILFLF